MVALWAALAATIAAAAAEWLHARRLRRMAYLAFGPAGRPPDWVRAVPVLRALALGGCAWALVSLWQLDAHSSESYDPLARENASPQHLVLALDVSPSMELADAGPLQNQPRAERAREVLKSLIDRLDLRRTRISVVAFYNSARPVVVDTRDAEVVTNILNDLPLEQAFTGGKTQMYSALAAATEIGRDWQPDSATLVLVGDGDSLPPEQPPRLPRAYHRALIVGVGDRYRGQYIDGHISRQDASSLEQLALRLGGEYFDANVRHLPSGRVSHLAAAPAPEQRLVVTHREVAIAALLAAAGCLALLSPALALFGAAWHPAAARPQAGFRFELPRTQSG